MNHLARLRERLGTGRKRRNEDWSEGSQYPFVWPADPPAAASEAPDAEEEFNTMLYTWCHPYSVFYCSRDLLIDILRASLSEKRLAQSGTEGMLEWVESQSEGVLLLATPGPPDWLVERHPGLVLELADGHTHWGPAEYAVKRILESQGPYRVHCLYCRRTYEASAVSAEEWEHRFGRNISAGRAFLCPEEHPLWMTTDVRIS